MAISVGPTAVHVQSNSAVFRQYSGGIMNSPDCGTATDHVVTAVGYGNENGTDYFLIRNSWGPEWGEDGYIRIAASLEGGVGICGV